MKFCGKKNQWNSESYFKYNKTIILKCIFFTWNEISLKIIKWNLWDWISFQNVVQAWLCVHLVFDILTRLVKHLTLHQVSLAAGRSRMVGLFLHHYFFFSLSALCEPRWLWDMHELLKMVKVTLLVSVLSCWYHNVRLSALWKQCYKRAGPAQSLCTIHRNDEIQIFTCLYCGFTDGGWCFGVVLACPSGLGSMHHGSPQVKDANSFADLL